MLEAFPSPPPPPPSPSDSSSPSSSSLSSSPSILSFAFLRPSFPSFNFFSLHSRTNLVLPAHLLLFLNRLGVFGCLRLLLLDEFLDDFLVDAADSAGVEHDGVRLELLQELMHFPLLPLLLRLERVRLERVEICEACPRNEQSFEAA
mmetsp:Transcript_67394/g.181262  ORF Transcript_67394/g.181262 Transcript_67394/m.181262 type:complete len:147 (+) Transcript_67394:161-601(+)